MKSIFENVIKSGSYDLDALLKRIDTYHIEGKLTEDDREALYAMARTSPKPQYDYSEEIPALWAAIGELKDAINPPEVDPTAWPAFVQPTGAHDAYNIGDQVTFAGKHYICQMDGCAWSPSTYPAAWVEQTAAPVDDVAGDIIQGDDEDD